MNSFLILVVPLAAVSPFTFFMWRNHQVNSFRLRILNEISDLSIEDIARGRDFLHRFDAFEQISYERMLFSFKPLQASNFWSDLAFLDGEDIK